jgi:Flp pilus assembly protein TadD
LSLAGAFHTSQAQTATDIVAPPAVVPQAALAENNTAAIQNSGEDGPTADAQAGGQQDQLSVSDPTNAVPTAGDTSESTTGSTESVRGTTQDVIGSKRLNTEGLGVLATMHPDFNAAKREFGEAVRLDSDNIEALNNLGYTYGRLGDYHSAEASLLKVVKIAPMRRAALGNLGYIEAKLGKTNEAAQYFCQYVRKFDSLQGGEDKLIHTMADPDPNVKEALAATLANCTRD